ncbi:pseudaminic acid synthase [Alkalibacillus almallahensis]|uniref:pseudaminic acid synthase n=1 Tax=Alkalibacillus almallahensis TaxID=1379154 RepID=UPI00142203F5|nr:pseudaminic acid synthase [Alkalibacillus almallahensis]NIK12250.1 pseudaminic acid synthase [Alkalibacillus almallahensis]
MCNLDHRLLKDRVLVIAELSANHGRDINIAKQTINAAAKSGADAIKLQTYTPDTMTIQSEQDYFKLNHDTIWDGRTLYDLYEEAYTPWEWHQELFDYAHEQGLICFSSPFDRTAVDLLETLNTPAYKIASFEITDIPLIKYAASKNKPMIISTGIGTIQEIHEAVEACLQVGNDDITLLKCTSAYPAKIEDTNLNTMVNFKNTFNTEIGLSDHTDGSIVPITAVSLGARVIEKHFILDKALGGPDATFSMEPYEFQEMVNAVRQAEKALGQVDYLITEQKATSRKLARSLFVVEDIQPGEIFTEHHVRSIRPGYGLSPKYLPEVLGKKANKAIRKGTPLQWNMMRD